MRILEDLVADPTVALHTHRGRGGIHEEGGPRVHLGATGAPKATVKTITTRMMIRLGMRIPNGMVKTITGVMGKNVVAGAATTVAGAMGMALGPKATAKTGTTVPMMGRGPRPGTTVPGGGGKNSARALSAQPSYSALGGRGLGRGRRAPAPVGLLAMNGIMGLWGGMYKVIIRRRWSVKAPRWRRSGRRPAARLWFPGWTRAAYAAPLREKFG